MKPFHPFPARMAHELALAGLEDLEPYSRILDPMVGSGTVLRHAINCGYQASGFDLDPLAVLISSVSTSIYDTEKFLDLVDFTIKEAKSLCLKDIKLDWIDDDTETREFTEFWFARSQRNIFRKLAFLLADNDRINSDLKYKKALMLSISKIIVTKEQRASLARDTSHSRPHRVSLENDFDVYKGLMNSAKQIARIMSSNNFSGTAFVQQGDARKLISIGDGSIDAIVTSPPYLNAIDYLRGHKLSLVWFGYKMSDIRWLRGISIGAEKSPDGNVSKIITEIAMATGDIDAHSNRNKNMILRYSNDLYLQLSQTARVLKKGGKAIYVVGNSCLKGQFVKNSNAVASAAKVNGIKLIRESEREIPANNRYLPIAIDNANSLSKRMRTEVVLSFEK